MIMVPIFPGLHVSVSFPFNLSLNVIFLQRPTLPIIDKAYPSPTVYSILFALKHSEVT